MIYYSVKDNKGITDITLNGNREIYRNFQVEKGVPVLFCTCKNTMIPMQLTAHTPIPHLQTKYKEDQAKHYRFCPHYIDRLSPSRYEPAIETNEDGSENARVTFTEDEEQLEENIGEEYRTNNQFIHNNRTTIYRRKMTFDAFIKYKNIQYFRINQYKKREFDQSRYNSNLWAFINHATVNKKPLEDLVPGSFIYSRVVSIRLAEKGKHYYIKTATGVSYTIRVEVVDKSIKKFQKTYNGLNLSQMLTAEDCHIILYGFKDQTKTKYPKYSNVGFLLVNKYGLFSESLNEVKMYNMLCDIIFRSVTNRYIFYKPTAPENIYTNPNFISDGVIRSKDQNGIVGVVEVFGRDDPEYIERKRQKEATCKFPPIFWDVHEATSFDTCKKILKDILT